MWWWLYALWLNAVRAADRSRSEQSSDWRDMWAGANYFITGDVLSIFPLDAEQLQRLFFVGPIRDFQMGQRPPYRFSFKAKTSRSMRLRVPLHIKDPVSGVTIVIRDIVELRSPEVQV